MSKDEHVDVADGDLSALRNGECWRDLTGDKLVYCLAAELQEAHKDRDAAERYAARQLKRAQEAERWQNTWKARFKSLVGNGTKAHAEKVAARLSRATFVNMKLREALLKITHLTHSDEASDASLAVAREALQAYPLREAPTVRVNLDLSPEYVKELTAIKPGEFNEQYMQTFPERRIGEADRRGSSRILDCHPLRRSFNSYGRRKTDVKV